MSPEARAEALECARLAQELAERLDRVCMLMRERGRPFDVLAADALAFVAGGLVACSQHLRRFAGEQPD